MAGLGVKQGMAIGEAVWKEPNGNSAAPMDAVQRLMRRPVIRSIEPICKYGSRDSLDS
jgi:hypothetical protein